MPPPAYRPSLVTVNSKKVTLNSEFCNERFEIDAPKSSVTFRELNVTFPGIKRYSLGEVTGVSANPCLLRFLHSSLRCPLKIE